ncbi:hypothetical protein GINT2_001941 [Glugoides intestinalis]
MRLINFLMYSTTALLIPRLNLVGNLENTLQKKIMNCLRFAGFREIYKRNGEIVINNKKTLRKVIKFEKMDVEPSVRNGFIKCQNETDETGNTPPPRIPENEASNSVCELKNLEKSMGIPRYVLKEKIIHGNTPQYNNFLREMTHRKPTKQNPNIYDNLSATGGGFSKVDTRNKDKRDV